jgi:hypothetical protein
VYSQDYYSGGGEMKAKKYNGKKSMETDILFPETAFIVYDENYNKIFKKVNLETLKLKYR